jgi:hypothetical protein
MYAAKHCTTAHPLHLLDAPPTPGSLFAAGWDAYTAGHTPSGTEPADYLTGYLVGQWTARDVDGLDAAECRPFARGIVAWRDGAACTDAALCPGWATAKRYRETLPAGAWTVWAARTIALLEGKAESYSYPAKLALEVATLAR